MMHQFTNTPCGRALARTERSLGRALTLGEMSDLLLDQFEQISDSTEAHQIRDCVLVFFGRTMSGPIAECDTVSAANA